MPPDNVNEQEIQFKKRARRRLVGAVALVLLMITILPMVLDDHTSKPPQQEIAITIPSQDGEFTSKIVPVVTETPEVEPSSANHQDDLETPGQQPIPSKADATAKSSATDTEMAQSNTANVDSPVGLSTNEIPKPVKPEPATAKPQPLSTAVPASTAIKESAKKEAQVKVAPTKASDNKAVKQSSVEKPGTFSLQIGVFSDAANVKQLQQKLATQNLKSYAEKLATPTGDKIRLR